jgi:glycosyltransferase involved in cell wall biosynthesis
VRKTPLSVVVLTRNEEANLPGCLASLRFAAQVVVVDAQSNDRTRELARKAGAEVHVRPWPGFTAQRNFALSKCRQDWILSVDADERISEPLADEISRLLEEGPRFEGYSIPEVDNYFGRWLRWGGIYPGRHMILFRREKARYGSGPADVHEKVDIGPVGRLEGHLIHWAYPSLELYLQKQNRYTDLEAKGRFRAGEQGVLYGMVWRPAERFLKNFVLKAGFLDGVHGFLYCATTAYYSFLTYAKLWELRQQPSETSVPEKGRR